MNTRAGDVKDEFDIILQGKRAKVEHFPVIQIREIKDKKNIIKIINKLDKYDGIFFTSSNGVKYFFDELLSSNKKYGGQIYSVGEKTSEKVRKYGYRSNFVPENYSADDMINELNKDKLSGKKFLFPRGNLSMEKIVKGLEPYAQIDEVVVYENSCPEYTKDEVESIKNRLIQKRIDCVAFFSPSAIENFFSLTGFPNRENINIAVIGNTTLIRAKEKGLKPGITAKKPTSEYLALAIVDYYDHN